MEDEAYIISGERHHRVEPFQPNGVDSPESRKMDKSPKRRRKKRDGVSKVIMSEPNKESERQSFGNIMTGTPYTRENQSNDKTDGHKLKTLVSFKRPETLQHSASTMKKLKIDSRVSMHYSKKELDQGLVKRYVEKFFKARICCQYVADVNSVNMCKCGRDINWHVVNGIVVKLHNSEDPWFPDSHTKQVPCTAFGEVSFCGFGRESRQRAPYIRVDAFDVNFDHVLTLMTDYWNVPPPKLIISITGGAKQFHWKKRLLDAFKTGIINAAKTTSAWIITGGMDAGVMKIVGDAVTENMLSAGPGHNNIVAIGIATWGYTGNRQALEGDSNNGLFPAIYNADDLVGKGQTPLNPGHTHFLLIDDGTDNQFGKEIEFWAEFQNYISERMETKIMQKHSVSVPVVLLVLEGGPNTLKTASSSIAKKTPIVAIEGSGRCADFIATAFKYTKPKPGSHESNFPPDFDQIMTAVIMQVFAPATPPDIKKYLKMIRTILQDRKYVTVFSLDDDNTTQEIDMALLSALLKVNQSSARTQLSLAVAWNRCDIAREQIFTFDNRENWQSLNLADAFFTALVQNRVDFVQLFLDVGVNLKKFLTVRRLRDLYEKVLFDKFAGNSRDLLKNLLSTINVGLKYYFYCGDVGEDFDSHSENLLFCVGSVISRLLGYQIPNIYEGLHFKVPTHENPEKPESVDNPTYSPQQTYSGPDSKQTGNSAQPHKIQHPERELLFWAVLLNRRELAQLFWRLGQDHVGGALISSSILKSLAKEAQDTEEIDLSRDFTGHSEDFEVTAYGLLSELYSKNKGLTHLLLIREMEHWGNITCFTLADTGEHMDFMGHTACQTRLNKIWRGRMALYTSNLKILATLFFPLLVWWIKFATRDSPVLELMDDQRNQDRNQDGRITKAELEDDIEEELENTAALGATGRKNLFAVSLLGRKNTISMFNALIYFYSAPVTKFLLTSIFYLFFMGIFSFFVMTDLRPIGPNSPTTHEYVTWIWVSTLIVEELRQLIVRDTRSFRFKVLSWYSNYWNRFDFLLYFVFIVAVILRLCLGEHNFVYARAFYAISVAMFYLRFMQIFYAHRDIGPKVIMIRRMMTDVFFFLCILAVFILAYGISVQALLFPNADADGRLFKSIFRVPYWQMYGELFLDRIEGDTSAMTCTFNETLRRSDSSVEQCPEKSDLVPVIFAGYMILTNILLLNLLIAMFSYTFQNVQENSDLVWRYYRHDLVYEYFDRPALVAPLIVIGLLNRVIGYWVAKCRRQPPVNTAFCVYLKKEHTMQVTAFERVGMEQYLVKFRMKDRDQINAKVASTTSKLEHVIQDLELIKEAVCQKGALEQERIEPNFIDSLTSEQNILSSDGTDELIHQRLDNLELQMSTIIALLSDRQSRVEPGDQYSLAPERVSRVEPLGATERTAPPPLRRRYARQNINYPDDGVPDVTTTPEGQGHQSSSPRQSHLDRTQHPYHSMYEEPNITITNVDST